MIDAALDPFSRAQFAMTDLVRRIQGTTLGAFGLDPRECQHRIVASGPHWRLRDYAGDDMPSPLLIVAAPIKRPYIWDLTPSVSALRYLLNHGLPVHLLEWKPAAADNCDHGLAAYVQAIAECVARIGGQSKGTKPLLFGHSLGGTLAAIFAASAPQSLRGLVLLGAPLCFDPATSRFRDALISLVPPTLCGEGPMPGSLLSHASALAAPGTFIWSRLMDAVSSINDRHALDIHARVERWALDEVALPGKLVHQIIEWLYRENRFCRGTLRVRNTRVGPFSLSVPTLAVVNVADEVAPLASVAPFVHAMPGSEVAIIECPHESGVVLPHLGILVGREARARVWPQIMSWLRTRN